MKSLGISRRNVVLGGLSTLAAGAVLPSSIRAGTPKVTLEALDKSSREHNVIAYLKIISDLSEKITYRYHTGRVLSVAASHQLAEPFMDFVAIKQDRVRALGNGSYQHAYRGVILFTELDTGTVLDEFANPLTGKTNKVEHFRTSRGSIMYTPKGIYSLRAGEKPSPLIPETDDPFRLLWTVLEDDVWVTYDERFAVRDDEGQLLYADNTMYRYKTSMQQLQSASTTSVDVVMNWGSETIFWPWMDMKNHPGHLIFGSMGKKYQLLDVLPAEEIAASEKYFPGHLSEPIKWNEYKLPSPL